jgi:hypothetical protein
MRKLVVLSGTFCSDGEYAHFRAFTSTFAPDLPMLAGNRETDIAAAGSAECWATLVEKMRRLLAVGYDWLGLVGGGAGHPRVDTDRAGRCGHAAAAHAVRLFGLLGGGTATSAMGGPGRAQLAVLPGTTHFTIL